MAIAYFHEMQSKVIHKDIKLENILINKECFIQICDLGLSKISDAPSVLDTTVGNNFYGTPLYMAPEISIFYEPVTTHSDVWALGCCIVEIFIETWTWTLSKPGLENLKNEILKRKKPDLSKVPSALRGIFSAYFDHEPKRRPEASTLLNTLKHFYKNDR
ncbi:serine/threonine-protein kinase Nek2-like [Chelonus insularis]|uniref:serine/threonine-protein kinase Nek2-like n=1 Tax=Chelonus insularis TaxID=460826 RepID=UPI00158954D9|nr:serine/threonine-protein kinase Nek2-like [Chelonus insularis]XP_034945109.1 serine/threonine-protein kinase Nek2-like [Chelonus insularis]